MKYTDEQIANALAIWAADVRPITGDAKKAWTGTLRGIDIENECLVKEAIEAVASNDSKGLYSKAPNRRDFLKEYRRLKATRDGITTTNAKGCAFCNQRGLVYVVIAKDHQQQRLRPVPRDTIIASSEVYVVMQPCSCDLGLNVFTPSFGYTWDKARRVVQHFGYSTEKEAWENRGKCESYYHQLRSKTGAKTGHTINQAIGYKNGQPVTGFFSNLPEHTTQRSMQHYE